MILILTKNNNLAAPKLRGGILKFKSFFSFLVIKIILGDFMTNLSYFILILFILLTVLTLIFAFKSFKPFKFLCFNAFLGLTTLFILYLTRNRTGLIVSINQYTIIGSSFLGIPAVLILLILNFITLM